MYVCIVHMWGKNYIYINTYMLIICNALRLLCLNSLRSIFDGFMATPSGVMAKDDLHNDDRMYIHERQHDSHVNHLEPHFHFATPKHGTGQFQAISSLLCLRRALAIGER